MLRSLPRIASLGALAGLSLGSSQGAVPSDPAPEPRPVVPTPRPPRDLHLRFWLEPADGGVRTLVLRDDADMVLPLGKVEPSWACDTGLDDSAHGDLETMKVVCGGDGLAASVKRIREKMPRPSSVTVQSGDVKYTIPFDHGAGLWLDGQLVDPASASCVAGDKEDVVVSVEAVATGNTGRWDFGKRLHVHATGVPLDANTDLTNDNPRWSIQESEAGDRLWVECTYDEPHADATELRVADGALLWTTVKIANCSGGKYPHGGWRLGCGSSVRWPRGPRGAQTFTPSRASTAPSEPRPAHYAAIE